MALLGISDNPTITDTIVFDILTPDVGGCFSANPYKVDRAIIFFVERSFSSGSDRHYETTDYDDAKVQDAVEAEAIACANPTADNIAEAKRLRAIADSTGVVSDIYFNKAVPVNVVGSDDFPAWLSTDTDNAFIQLVPEDEDGNAQYGHFQLIWEPKGEIREGDYFICWTWTMQPAGDQQSSNMPFSIGGNTQVTTSIPTHFTVPGKYETLLERYLPETFKEYLVRGDLTPDVMDKLNQAIAKGFTQLEDLANQTIDLYDANAINETLLPFLSNLFNLKLKSGDPTLWRRQVKEAVPLFKRKGTLGSLRDALSQAGMELTKYTPLWQVISKYTWVDSFKVEKGQEEFILTKAMASLDLNNFELSYRESGTEEYVVLDSSYASFSTDSGITTMTWEGETNATPIALFAGDMVKVLYPYKTVPDQNEQMLEDYVRTLSLADQRDEADQAYPLKNWNVRLIEQDDPLFDAIVSSRHPFHDDIIFGYIRTEFPYSENIYNMDDYNGCVVSSTIVNTYEGLFKVGEKEGEPLNLLTEYGYKTCETVKSQGVRKTLKIQTKMGRTLTVTPNHEFRVMGTDGQLHWRRADSLESGDYLLGKRGDPALTISSGLDGDTWYMAGLVYGDGYLYKNKINLMVPESEPTTSEAFQKYMRLHGSKFYITLISPEEHRKHVHFTCNESITRLSTTRNQAKSLGDILPEYQPKGQWKQHVPDELWSSGKEQISCFLRGLFDTDGGVQRKSAAFTSKWKSLCQEVQMLLLRLGILSSVSSYKVTWKGVVRSYYRTRIVGRNSINRFISIVGFGLERKQNSLREAQEVDCQLLADRTVIPHSGNLVRSIFPRRTKKSRHQPHDRTREEKRILTMITRLKQGYLTVIPDNCASLMLDKALEFGEDCKERDFLRDYVEQDWFFDRVSTVVDGGEHEVFDPVNVQDSQSYLSNGLVSHNSTRPSTNPCDIAPDFLDPCSNGLSSKFTLDVEIQEFSNDRLIEATQVIKEYVPFHSVLHTLNASGSVYEFIPSPVEDVECLISYVINDVVISGSANSQFYRIMDDPLGPKNIKRTLLATSEEVVSEQTAIAYNDVVVLYCPNVRFDRLPLDMPGNVLEIFAPSPNSGVYSVSNPYRNTVEVQANSEPINEAAFTFRLSNDLYFNPSAVVQQDNQNYFSDASANFAALSLKTQWDVDNSSYTGGIWKLSCTYGTFPILDLAGDGSLILDGLAGGLPNANASGIAYSVSDGDGVTQATGTAGVLKVTLRGRVTLNDVTVSDLTQIIKHGDYLLFGTTQYRILGFVEGTLNKVHIAGYSLGNAAGVPVNVYRRLADQQIGYFQYKGINLHTFTDLEVSLGIQNGANAPDVSDWLEDSDFKENFLIQIDDTLYQIVDIDGQHVTLGGPMNDWKTLPRGGTTVVYSILQFNKSRIKIGSTDFMFIDRRGGEEGQDVSKETEFIPYDYIMSGGITTDGDGDGEITSLHYTSQGSGGVSMGGHGPLAGVGSVSLGPLIQALNNGSEVKDMVSQNESIAFTIEYADGTKEEGKIE